MHHIINDADVNNSGLLSSCLYTNANDIWEYPILKLVFVITNYKQYIASNKDSNLLILIYKNNGCYIFFNNWKNPNYFILTFWILFLFSNKSYSTTFNNKKTVKLSF